MKRASSNLIVKLWLVTGFTLLLVALLLVPSFLRQPEGGGSEVLEPGKLSAEPTGGAGASSNGDGAGQQAAGQAAPTPGQILPTADEGEALFSGELLWGAVPIQAEAPPDLPDWAKELLTSSPEEQNTGGLVLTKSATSTLEENRVYNGEKITYTIVARNEGSIRIENVLLLDDLPQQTFESVECSNDCTKIYEEIPFQDPLGSTVLVTVTRRLTWTISALNPGQSIAYTFSARVVGQSDGTTFTNQVIARYSEQDQTRFATSNKHTTTVRVRIDRPGQRGVAGAPTWLSTDLGGTLSQDWGDFDKDGFIDLALGSSVGVTVYRNNKGRLENFWSYPGSDKRSAYGVKWADFTGDGELELVVVGSSEGSRAAAPGTNYIYKFDPTAISRDHRFTTLSSFPSPRQLIRVEAGDFNEDGYVDLVASTNWINAQCPVLLMKNEIPESENPAQPFSGKFNCVSEEATATLAAADYNNDGRLDLALGLFESQTIRLALNHSGSPEPILQSAVLTTSNPSITSVDLTVPIDNAISFLPYDFAWGDYDGDGYLDLAAAFPLQREVRVYRNLSKSGGGWALPIKFKTSLFRTPLALDWGDMTGNGKLELVVADSPPKVYEYKGASAPQPFVSLPEMSLPSSSRSAHQLWSIRVVDQENDGDLDLAITNRDGPSMLFTSFSLPLNRTINSIYPGSAGSVAWGDANGDGLQDLLFGAGSQGSGLFVSKLYYNQGSGRFNCDSRCEFAGFGPGVVAFGDVDGDDSLEMMIGTQANNQLYVPGEVTNSWSSSNTSATRALAWGDATGNGLLDLLVGSSGEPLALYVNWRGQLSTEPQWRSSETGEVRSLAWADYNNDGYLDFAVGYENQPVQLYRNAGNLNFELIWTSRSSHQARALAWGDYDGDGDLDLAVGDYGGPNVIYQNQLKEGATGSGALTVDRVWNSGDNNKTTSLAWGDWNSDGDLDLAVGNDGAPDQVFENLGSSPGSPQIYWLWKSKESYRTSGVAWGDYDGDGDLDLAISQDGSGANGVYVNNYTAPIHLTTDVRTVMPLPNNSLYLSIDRPGATKSAYYYSSEELLSGPLHPTVTVEYKLYHPDSWLEGAEAEIPINIFYEYSVDGGGRWRTATPAGPVPPLQASGERELSGTFHWDAQADQAISDNALFRIRAVQRHTAGRLQGSSSSAISPPFRVRGTTCIWPYDIAISANPLNPEAGTSVTFLGTARASGNLNFRWNFGDGASATGQLVQHTFEEDGTYDVTLTVTGEACPLARLGYAKAQIVVGSGITPIYLHLPIAPLKWQLVLSDTETITDRTESLIPPQEQLPAVILSAETSSSIPQVEQFKGDVDPATGQLQLEWSPGEESAAIEGYRIYRYDPVEGGAFQPIATVPATASTYSDRDAACGQIYYITALQGEGESLPSESSYFSPPCQSEAE